MQVLKPYFFIILALVFLQSVAEAQIPKYSFNIYIEDAVGNMDSITIVGDSLVDAIGDTDFGFINLTDVPFDSVLEVRGGDLGGGDYLSKIMPWYSPNTFCTVFPFTQYVTINIHAKHFPLTMRWDSAYFEEECIDWSHLTRNWAYMHYPSAFPPYYAYPMKHHSSITFDENDLRQTYSFLDNYKHAVEGGGKDTVWVFFLGLAGNQPSNGINELPVATAKSYPNPASGAVQVELPERFGVTYRGAVWDVMGKMVQAVSEEKNPEKLLRIDVGGYPPGVYFVRLTDDAERSLVSRVVVSRE